MLSLVVCTLLFVGAPEAPSTPGAAAPQAAAEPQVQGRVTEQGTRAPVAGAQVMLMVVPQGPPPTAVPSMARPPSTTTDAEGQFRFSGVVAGRYRVIVQKPGFALPVDTTVRLPEVAVAPGASAGPVDVVLQRGAVITGQVVDAHGEPVVNARVLPLRKRPDLSPAAPAALRDVVARLSSGLVGAGPGATTDDRGEYRIHSLPAGEYYLQAMPMPGVGVGASSPAASDTAFVPTFHPDATSPDGAQAVTVASGQALDGLTIRMATAAVFQVSGMVVDESGAPVAEALVHLAPADPADAPLMMVMSGITRTDARGAFVLPQVRGGRYALIAAAPTVIARDAVAPVGPGSTTTGMVGGTVSGPAGAMITTETRNGVTVRYREDQGTKVVVTITDGGVADLRLVVQRALPQ